MTTKYILFSGLLALCGLTACQHNHTTNSADMDNKQARWLAGDHHVHSIYSAKWDHSTYPATPILAGDAINSTLLNLQMAHKHGLSWLVTTDHGGPGHSQLNFQQAYPALVAARQAVPEVMAFYGMEFDTPGARHSTLIIPHFSGEAQQLLAIESRYNRREIYPDESPRDNDPFMAEALAFMARQQPAPLLLVNHPARTASGLGEYGKVTPARIRQWHDSAANVVIGMTALPGHQAATLHPDGSQNPDKPRAEYFQYPTMGGYDQMTARLGGFWDSMLGEGRHWWITAASDSHAHYTTGRTDFWPGEYSKLYVHAKPDYASVMENLRAGRMFVTSGDLINQLELEASNSKHNKHALMGQTLTVNKGDSVTIRVRFSQPDSPNFNGQRPKVARLDIIAGDIIGPSADLTRDVNPTTRVVGRYWDDNFTPQGQYQTVELTIEHIRQSQYLRVRGTNLGDELEPQPDHAGEDPWSDLWFYSNPIFIKVLP